MKMENNQANLTNDNDSEIARLSEIVNTAKANKDYPTAISACEKLANEFDYFGYKIELPRLYYENGDYEKAIAYVDNWFEKIKEDTAAIGFIIPQIGINKLLALKKLSRTQEAKQTADLICAISKDVIANMKRNYGENCDTSLQETPMAVALGEIGEIYFEQRDYKKAGEYFGDANRIRLTYISAYYSGCCFLYGLSVSQNIKGAKEYLNVIANVDPNTDGITNRDKEFIGKACIMLSVIYTSQTEYKDPQKAQQYLQKARDMGCLVSDAEIQKAIENIPKTTQPVSTAKKSGGCYVATCVYGSYDCPQVWTLRRYRDSVLAESTFGRLFIRIYYAISPTAVKYFGKFFWFHRLFKTPLDKLVRHLQKEGIEDTPYQDRKEV